MPIPTDMKLYEKVKEYANKIYSKPSAYKSGFIVQEYKRRGGTYINDNKKKKLKQWYDEKWEDIGHLGYPVYRPTVKIDSSTPLTKNEIDKTNLKNQIMLKQKIKGNHNLPPFISNH